MLPPEPAVRLMLLLDADCNVNAPELITFGVLTLPLTFAFPVIAALPAFKVVILPVAILAVPAILAPVGVTVNCEVELPPMK